MLQDVRFALRLLMRHRGYAAIAILTVALGVGANTAVFSVADSVLFRPLPFAEVDRLHVLRIGNPKTGEVYGTVGASSVEAARALDLFDAVAPVSGRSIRAYVTRDGALDVLSLAPVSREFLEVLNVRPALGRRFDGSDTGTRAVLLSYKTWMSKHGGDAGIVGRTLPAAVRTMDETKMPDQSVRIVGVLPPRLRMPLASADDGVILMEDPRTAGPWPPLVRLEPGVDATAAQARLSVLQQPPDLVPGKSSLRIVPLREELAARQDPVLWLLLGASAIVLFVACVNLANLMLARGSARARELAVRAALGGSRRRLVRLLVVEGAVVAAFGAVLGLAAAYWGFRALTATLPPVLAAVADPVFDVRAFGFAAVIASLSAIAFSVLPAMRLVGGGARNGLGLGRMQLHAQRRGRQVLVALEVAICLALLVGAGLVGRSLIALLSQDMGFASHRLVASFDLPTLVIRQGTRVRADTVARAAFVEARLREIRGVAGVRAAGVVSSWPYSGIMPEAPLTGEPDGGGVYFVTSGYFRAVGMRMLAGRDIADEESFAASPVAVLNESAARKICGSPEQCPGRVVLTPNQLSRTIVGVVRDARPSLKRGPTPTMYVPFDVRRFSFGSIVIDSDDTPENREGLKRALSSPSARVEVRSLDEARDREMSPFRFNALIVGALAILTLLLSAVGVYGVMAAVVGERTREYGIRLALGATREDVNRHVLVRAVVPIACGAVAGVVLALWGSRFIGSLLYGVVPLDAGAFAIASAVVVASGVAAAYVPARRAGRVDPIVALRAE